MSRPRNGHGRFDSGTGSYGATVGKEVIDMPHYVLELKRPKDAYAVYSTIVDNLITAPMNGEQMRTWLEEREYTSWLKKGGDTLDELTEKFGEDVARDIHQNQLRNADWFYWNEEQGFTFAKEADAYFCLPRSAWREE